MGAATVGSGVGSLPESAFVMAAHGKHRMAGGHMMSDKQMRKMMKTKARKRKKK